MADWGPDIVNVHTGLVPEQAPLHPPKVELPDGVAVSVTELASGKLALHFVPQEMPAGLLVTVPVPAPDFVTVSLTLKGLNVAVTDFAAFMVTEHVFAFPEHAPLQPANLSPVPAVAVNFTTVPLAKLAEHVVPQLIPDGRLVIVPVPVPASAAVRVKLPPPALKVAVTDLAALIVTAHAPFPEQAPLHPKNVAPPVGVAVNVTMVPPA